MDFSVIVCNYNAQWGEIEFTLNSIINQKDVDFEIIFSDDGSKENPSKLIEDFFTSNNFTNFKLRTGKPNVGTVKALFDATSLSAGKYIKSIGTGDAFANNHVLRDVNRYMNEKKAKILFTGIIPFYMSKGVMKNIKGFSIPRSLKCWRKNKYEVAKENIIVYNDQISGSSLFYEKEYMQHLMNIIKEHVIYMEDLIQYLALLEDERIHFIPEGCILYESSTGISTDHSESNLIRMRTDKNNFLNYIFSKYQDNNLIKRRYRLECLDKKITNNILKGIIKEIYEPKWIYFKLLKMRRS